MAFHVSTRAFQESKRNDPKWGRVPPTHVSNRDQVPICLACAYATTIDELGKDCICDTTATDADKKRFCTLDLHIPMRVNADKSNIRKPHIIFRADRFCKGCDWKGTDKKDGSKERDEWNPNVTVSFQENAWVDAQTNIYGIEEQAKNPFFTSGEEFIQLEDNLSSHKTEAVDRAWRLHLPHWIRRYFPAQMTWCLQPIDRHVGKRYKIAVYRKLRSIMVERLMACNDGEAPKALSAREKRILITHVVAQVHAELCADDVTFERAHIATGSWMPIDGSRDDEVKLQGMDDYDYAAVCSRQAIDSEKADQKAAADQAEAEELARVQQAQLEADQRDAERAVLDAKWQSIKNAWSPRLIPGVKEKAADTFEKIAAATKLSSFVVYGSYPAYLIGKVLREIRDRPNARLVGGVQPTFSTPEPEDIDIAHGPQSDGLERGNMYGTVDANVELPVNTIAYQRREAAAVV